MTNEEADEIATLLWRRLAADSSGYPIAMLSETIRFHVNQAIEKTFDEVTAHSQMVASEAIAFVRRKPGRLK